MRKREKFERRRKAKDGRARYADAGVSRFCACPPLAIGDLPLIPKRLPRALAQYELSVSSESLGPALCDMSS